MDMPSTSRSASAKYHGRYRNQAGVALITALLVAVLVSILAVSMISGQQVDIRRTANVIDGDQAYMLARGAEDWSAHLLRRNARQSETDNLGEDWAQVLLPTEVEGGTVSGYVEDMQGRFNLNNLLAEDEGLARRYLEQFERLLDICGIETDKAQAVLDWLDSDSDTLFPGGAEDDLYLGLDTSSRPANTGMISPSELRLVMGFDNDAFRCLSPHICTLPAPTKINVNTASAAVLAALSDALSLEQAEKIIKNRPPKGYGNMADFLNQPELAGTAIDKTLLTEKSGYFMAHISTGIGRGRITLQSLFTRQENRVAVIFRRIGNY